MTTKLHTFIQAHIEAQFPGCLVKCATNPNEEWLAIIVDASGRSAASYVATMHGDSEGLAFLRTVNQRDSGYPPGFDVILTDDEMMDAVRETHSPYARLPDELQGIICEVQAEDVREDPSTYAADILAHEEQDVIDGLVLSCAGDWFDGIEETGKGTPNFDLIVKAIRDAAARNTDEAIDTAAIIARLDAIVA